MEEPSIKTIDETMENLSVFEDSKQSRSLRDASVTAILSSITSDDDGDRCATSRQSTIEVVMSDDETPPSYRIPPLLGGIPYTPDRCMSAHRGTLIIYLGPMFSGKTTRLNYDLTRFADKGLSTLKIVHAEDIRDDVASSDMSGSTHNSSYRSLSSKIKCVRVSELSKVDVSAYHAIGIDEAQFYPDIYQVVERWVEIEGKHVRIAGLDGDYSKRKFGQVLDLIPMCDKVKKLTASCVICLAELKKTNFHGNIFSLEAPFTKRLGTSTQQKDVGGSDKYIPVCRYHHSA
jgi:thymidine kinase